MSTRRSTIWCAAAAVTGIGSCCGAARGDVIFGDFESGLDANLEVVQFNGGPNTFNGSVATGVSHGSMAGSFTTAPNWQQYLRYNEAIHGPGSVSSEMANYNSIAVDIDVPAGTDPMAFFVNEMVINATGFGFAQSGNVNVAGNPDVKGRGLLTLEWNYRAGIADFDAKYAAFLADPMAFFQILLVSNHSDTPSIATFTLDNWRLTNPVAVGATWNVNADSTWSTPGNWQPNAPPNAVGAVANFGPVITAPRTVTVDAPQTVGAVNFDNVNRYTIAGPGALTMDVASGSASINVTTGSHTISAPLVLNDDLNVNVAPADAVLTLSGAMSATGRTISKAGAGRVDLPVLSAGGLTVNAGTARLSSGGGTSRVNSLSVAGGAAPTARLDLTNNALVVDYGAGDPSPLATVKAQVAAGFAAGNWSGNGIVSAAADANQFAVGYGEASALSAVPAVFGAVDATALLLRLTRYGDANLDGQVNLQDFNRLAASFGAIGTGVWTQGDFNYDGNVNLQDFNRLAANFGTSAAGPDVTPADWAALASAVPEPSLGFAFVGAAALLARVRRRNHIA